MFETKSSGLGRISPLIFACFWFSLAKKPHVFFTTTVGSIEKGNELSRHLLSIQSSPFEAPAKCRPGRCEQLVAKTELALADGFVPVALLLLLFGRLFVVYERAVRKYTTQLTIRPLQKADKADADS